MAAATRPREHSVISFSPSVGTPREDQPAGRVPARTKAGARRQARPRFSSALDAPTARERARNVKIEFDDEERGYVENPGRALPLGGENRRGIMRDKKSLAEDDDINVTTDPREYLWWRILHNPETYQIVRTTVTNVVKDHTTKRELVGETPCGTCVIPFAWDRFGRDPDQTFYPNGTPADVEARRRSTNPASIREELLRSAQARLYGIAHEDEKHDDDDLTQVGSERRQAILRQKQQNSRELRLLVRKLAVASAEKGASDTALWPLCEAVTAKLSKSDEPTLPSRHETAINLLNNLSCPAPIPGLTPVRDASGQPVTKPVRSSKELIINVYKELLPPLGADEDDPPQRKFVGAYTVSLRYIRFHRFAHAVRSLCRVKRLPVRMQAQVPPVLLDGAPSHTPREYLVDDLLESLVFMPKMLLQCLYDSARLRSAVADWFAQVCPPGKNRLPPMDTVQFCYELQAAVFPSFETRDNVAVAEDDLKRMHFCSKDGVELEGFYQSLFELAMLMHPRHVTPTEDSVDAFLHQLRKFVAANAAKTKDAYKALIEGQRTTELREYRLKVMTAHVDDPGARAMFEPLAGPSPYCGSFDTRPHHTQSPLASARSPQSATQKAFLGLVKAEFPDTRAETDEDRKALQALLASGPTRLAIDGPGGGAGGGLFDPFADADSRGSGGGADDGVGEGSTYAHAVPGETASVSTAGEELDAILETLAEGSDDSEEAVARARARIRQRRGGGGRATNKRGWGGGGGPTHNATPGSGPSGPGGGGLFGVPRLSLGGGPTRSGRDGLQDSGSQARLAGSTSGGGGDAAVRVSSDLLGGGASAVGGGGTGVASKTTSPRTVIKNIYEQRRGRSAREDPATIDVVSDSALEVTPTLTSQPDVYAESLSANATVANAVLRMHSSVSNTRPPGAGSHAPGGDEESTSSEEDTYSAAPAEAGQHAAAAAARLDEFDAILDDEATATEELRNDRSEKLRLQVRRALQARRVTSGRKTALVLDNISFRNRYRPSTTLGSTAVTLGKRKAHAVDIEPPAGSMYLIRNRTMMARIEGLQAHFEGIVSRAGEPVTFRNLQYCHAEIMAHIRDLQLDGDTGAAAAVHDAYKQLLSLPTAYLAANEERERRAKQRQHKRQGVQQKARAIREPPTAGGGLGVFPPSPSATVTPRPDTGHSWTHTGGTPSLIDAADLQQHLEDARVAAGSGLSMVSAGVGGRGGAYAVEVAGVPPPQEQQQQQQQLAEHRCATPLLMGVPDGMGDNCERDRPGSGGSGPVAFSNLAAPPSPSLARSARPTARVRQTQVHVRPGTPASRGMHIADPRALYAIHAGTGASAGEKVVPKGGGPPARVAASRLHRAPLSATRMAGSTDKGGRRITAAKQRRLQDIGQLELAILEHAGYSKTPHPPKAFRNMMRILCDTPASHSSGNTGIIIPHQANFVRSQLAEAYAVTAVVAVVAAVQPECERTIKRVEAATGAALCVAFIAGIERFYGQSL